jgi:averantin hydroxylase
MEGRLQHYAFAENRMRDRMALGTDNGDFLDAPLQKMGKEGGLDFDELVSNGGLLVIAGSETTASLLSGTIYHLCKNPSTLKKAVTEVRSTFKSADEIDLYSTSKLPYTLAVLDETLRIYPPVPNQPPREAPPSGGMIDGKFIPGGTQIYVSQYVMGRLDTYWTKPDEFHPERFLKDIDQVPDEFKGDDHSTYQPFSVGPRNCIGKTLAYAEMRLILTRLLYGFDFELDARSTNWVGVQKVYKLWEKPPLWVKVTPKNQKL